MTFYKFTGKLTKADWKQQARNHEHSANEYARLYHKEKQANAELLEALEALYSVTVHQSQYSAEDKRLAEELAAKAIRKVK